MALRSTLNWLLLSAILCSLSTGVAARTLQVGIYKNRAVEAQQLERRSAILQRRNAVTADIGNALQQGLYYANVTVGTPGQSVSIQIDTGSSDVWVPSTQAQICRNRPGCPGGSFSPGDSSTFELISEDAFNISYVDNTGALGSYFQDTFSFGGVTLDKFTMGLGEGSDRETSISVGVMGIGYNNSEANTLTGTGSIYANFPVALVDSGDANSYAYSLWLNDLESDDGQILFGGIDTRKYSGNLIAIDVYPDTETNSISSFTVAWTSLRVTSTSGSDQLTSPQFAAPVILDSGTTISLLPGDMAYDIFEEVGASVSQALGAIVVPCELADKDGNFTYQFGGPNGPSIDVPVSQLVLPLSGPRGLPPTYEDGRTACQLGIQPAGDEDPILFGDTFLRSAYVVYDLYNNRIALAPTVFNETKSNVVEFESLGAAIPSASVAESQTAVKQSATAIPRISLTVSVSADSQPTYNPTATAFSAASGFQAMGTSGTKKKSGAASVRPFPWSGLVVGLVSLGLAGIGGAVFAIL